MSIFLVSLIALMIAAIVFLIGLGIVCAIDSCSDAPMFIVLGVSICAWIIGIFVGIGMCDEDDRVYVQKYLAQKNVIEQSLDNEDLTGFERIELVNKAAELNGELAERKATFELWHVVHYDNTIYDGVEFINLKKGE